MNGTIERPVEEQTESRGSAFIATTENPFFDGVFRQYHLDAEDGIYNIRNLNLFSYAYNNPVILKDPDGNFVVAIEYNRKNAFGAIAFQTFENGKLVEFYDGWLTRGVSENGGEVAPESGLYSTKVTTSQKEWIGRSPEINGGKSIKKEGGGTADHIRIHKMNNNAVINPEKHGGKKYFGSEGCQGPHQKDWNRFMGKDKNVKDEKKENEGSAYILIRGSDIADTINGLFKGLFPNAKQRGEK